MNADADPSRCSMIPALPCRNGASAAADHADLDLAALQQIVELLVARAVHQAVDLVGALVPPLLERGLAGEPGGLADGDVARIEVAVADDLDLVDPGDILADELEDRRAEIAGDAAVGSRTRQPVLQENMGKPALPRTEAVEQRIACPLIAPERHAYPPSRSFLMRRERMRAASASCGSAVSRIWAMAWASAMRSSRRVQ